MATVKPLPLLPVQTRINVAELYKEPPPAFGHGMLKLFGFDPNYTNLNHGTLNEGKKQDSVDYGHAHDAQYGSYGSLPLPVRTVCEEWADEAESNPDKFLRLNVVQYIARVRERVAKLLGADTDECVMVNNTSHGITTILRNLMFNEGDILIEATTTYGSVSQTLKYLTEIPPHPTLSTFDLQLPTSRSKIVEDFREHIKQVTQTPDVTGKRTIVALIDSIASTPGVYLPWKEMVAICREAGVISLVDGAHSIGQELDINLSESRPDFFVTNCHKWLFSKRGSAVLYVPKRNQHFIKSPIPTTYNYLSPLDEHFKYFNHPQDFVKLFECTLMLSIGAAINFREWLGGEHKINKYTRALAIEGGKHLAELLGTSVIDPDGELTLNMTNVELPIPDEVPYFSHEVQRTFLETLLLEWNVSAFFYKHNGKWWIRCSAQIWNEISDFEVIANALKDVSQKLNLKDFASQENP